MAMRPSAEILATSTHVFPTVSARLKAGDRGDAVDFRAAAARQSNRHLEWCAVESAKVQFLPPAREGVDGATPECLGDACGVPRSDGEGLERPPSSERGRSKQQFDARVLLYKQSAWRYVVEPRRHLTQRRLFVSVRAHPVVALVAVESRDLQRRQQDDQQKTGRSSQVLRAQAREDFPEAGCREPPDSDDARRENDWQIETAHARGSDAPEPDGAHDEAATPSRPKRFGKHPERAQSEGKRSEDPTDRALDCQDACGGRSGPRARGQRVPRGSTDQGVGRRHAEEGERGADD